MNIDQINRTHYVNRDIYFRVSYGLASKLLRYDKGVIYIELEIRKKWKANYDTAVREIAQSWKNANDELKKAVACHVSIIDSKRFPYKRTLIHLGIKPGYDLRKAVNF